jgi:hypothetical protein
MSHVIPVNQVDSTGVDATDPATRSVRVNVVAGGGGGGGGAMTVADGADVAEGATTDAAWAGSGAGSVVALLKRLATTGGRAPVTISGTIVTTNDTITLDVTGQGTLFGFNTGQTGGFSANLQLEVSPDGVNYTIWPYTTNNSGAQFQLNGAVPNWVPYLRANIAGAIRARLRHISAPGGTTTWVLAAAPTAFVGNELVTLTSATGQQVLVSGGGALVVDASGQTLSVQGGFIDPQTGSRFFYEGALHDDTLAALNPGIPATFRMTPFRAQHVSLRDQNGNEPCANVTVADAGTFAASFLGTTQTNRTATSAYITVRLGTVSGGTPTLGVQLQWSPDGGTTWLALGAVLPTLTATGQTGTIVVAPSPLTGLTLGATVSVLITAPLPRTWRLAYTIGGSTPSVQIANVAVNYVP